LEFPRQRLTVNLAPAELRKEGSGLDWPIAVAIALAVMRKAPPPRSAFLGELALDGTVCHADGVLVAARWLRGRGYERVFVPAADAAEAALVDGLEDGRLVGDGGGRRSRRGIGRAHHGRRRPFTYIKR